ncbi:hypothetical protein INR49_014064 [Caranx melampygus]|nr:hypothetical protein INR49_014064 [Caranx melampygus]
MEIPAINLKAIVLVHWLLTVWGCMAWLPPSYSWGNFGVLAVGVWAIAQRDSIDAVLMFLMGMIVTILTDIIHFGIYYPAYAGERGRDVFRFSAGMAILNLLLKPVSCFFVYQMYRERGGDYNINFEVTGNIGGKMSCHDGMGCVSRLYHETETPTSPLTSRMSPPAPPIPSTRPRTANQEPAHTERSRQCFPSDSFMQQCKCSGTVFTIDSSSVHLFCTVSLLQVAALKTKLNNFYYGKSLILFRF